MNLPELHTLIWDELQRGASPTRSPFTIWQLATLGIACISNDKRHANEILSKVVSFVEESRRDLELVDYETEIISGV